MTAASLSPAAVLDAVDRLGPAGTPVTTPEVAEGFDCTPRTIYNKLNALVDDGVLQTKKVGANSRVWWRPAATTSSDTNHVESHADIESKVDQLYERDIGVYTLDADLRVTYLNEQAAVWLDITSAAVRGEFILDMFEPNEDALTAFHEALDTQTPTRFLTYYPPWERWFDNHVYPTPAGLTIYFTDVTERKNAERDDHVRMETAEARYRSLLESTTQGFAIVEVLFDDGTPVDYRFVETNAAFEAQTGLTSPVGKRIRDIDPEHDSFWFELYGEVVETGEPAHAEGLDNPETGRWWDVHVTRVGPVADRQVAILFDDVTERKRLQQTLQMEEEQMKMAVENSPLTLFRLDTDLRYTWVKSPVPEFDEEDVLGRRDDELLPPEDAEKVMAPKRTALETGKQVREEVTYELPNGEVTYDLTVAPLRDEGGTIVGLTCAAFEITERKRRERNVAFLDELGSAVNDLGSPEEIVDAVGAKLHEYLDVAFYNLQAVDEAQDTATYLYRWNETGVLQKPDVIQLSEFVNEEFRAAARRGETIVSTDTHADAFTDAVATDSIMVQSYITVPFHRDGEWEYLLTVSDSRPRTWRSDQVELVDELAKRIFPRLERAQAEQALQRTIDALQRLNIANRDLLDAEPETIRNSAADVVGQVLDVEYAALRRYDDVTGELREHGQYVEATAGAGERQYPDNFADQVWQAFIGDDVHVTTDITTEEETGALQFRTLLLVPLGRHGVVCAGTRDADGFDEQTIDIAETLGATLETTWNRAEGEKQVAVQNEELHRLDNLNALIRSIDQDLVAATTREEIDSAVCDRLAAAERYEFAWLAEYDAATNTIQPKEWAGVDSGYLEARAVTMSDAPADDPLVAAFQTHELQVIADITTDPRSAPWRAAALERGARSCIKIPLVYEEGLYAILTVYGRDPNPDERETEVLAELGATIAHAINAVETKATLQSESVVELTLEFPRADAPLCRLSQAAECEIAFQGFVPRADGETDLFFTASDVTPTALCEIADQTLAFVDLTCITERAAGSLYRGRVSDPPLVGRIAEAGGVVRSLTIEGGIATAVIDVPHTAAVRAFLDRMQRWDRDVELLARHPRERPLKTHRTFVAAIEDRLTDRQLEVLQTAYLSGFFESPRASTGQGVTELLGVSQPTFSEHLRTAERRLCAVLFDDE